MQGNHTKTNSSLLIRNSGHKAEGRCLQSSERRDRLPRILCPAKLFFKREGKIYSWINTDREISLLVDLLYKRKFLSWKKMTPEDKSNPDILGEATLPSAESDTRRGLVLQRYFLLKLLFERLLVRMKDCLSFLGIDPKELTTGS